MEIKRYNMEPKFEVFCDELEDLSVEAVEDPAGDFVKYSDAKLLQDLVKDLESSNDALNKEANNYFNMLMDLFSKIKLLAKEHPEVLGKMSGDFKDLWQKHVKSRE